MKIWSLWNGSLSTPGLSGVAIYTRIMRACALCAEAALSPYTSIHGIIRTIRDFVCDVSRQDQRSRGHAK